MAEQIEESLLEREEILAAAKRLSLLLGEAPTIRQFHNEAGVKDSYWKGKYWARWSDLLADAGIDGKAWKTPAIDREVALEKYWKLALDLDALPVEAQMNLRKRQDPEFPNPSTLRKHFGGDLILLALQHAESNGAPERVLELLRAGLVQRSRSVDATETDNEAGTGFVYLMKSGRHYKIGKTNSLDRRKYEIGLQLPEKLEPIHSVETDDPSGIEAYWHNRFKDKRLNGEWFELTAADVRAFKRRKNFM